MYYYYPLNNSYTHYNNYSIITIKIVNITTTHELNNYRYHHIH